MLTNVLHFVEGANKMCFNHGVLVCFLLDFFSRGLSGHSQISMECRSHIGEDDQVHLLRQLCLLASCMNSLRQLLHLSFDPLLCCGGVLVVA